MRISIDWNTMVVIECLGMGILLILSILFLVRKREYLIRRLTFLLIGAFGLLLFIINPNLASEIDKYSKSIRNNNDILNFLAGEEAAQVDTVRLNGSKYNPSLLNLLQDYYLDYKPDTIFEGFSAIEIPSITERENWMLRGKCSLPEGAAVLLTTADGSSVASELQANGNFELFSQAPSEGRYEYTLSAYSPEGDSISERLPIQVKKESKLNMLVIAESPSFELNYFKNYWSNLGHGLVLHVRIAIDKFSTTYVNYPRTPINKITAKLLGNINVLMLDQSTWNALSKIERQVIQKESEEKALAVILRMNKLNESLRDLPSIRASSFTSEDFAETELTKVEFLKNSRWQSFEEHAILDYGFGKFLVLAWNTTYNLILNDKTKEYQKIWADLISEMYLEKQSNFEVETDFPVFAEKSSDVRLINLRASSEYSLNGRRQLKLMNSPLIESFARSEMVPQEGWNYIEDANSKEKRYFFAFGDGEWSLLQSESTARYIENFKAPSGNLSTTYTTKKSFPWLFSLLITLLGFGLLWVDEKVNG